MGISSLNTDLTSVTADEFTIKREALLELASLHQATAELSVERRVAGLKVIPIKKMLYLALEHHA